MTEKPPPPSTTLRNAFVALLGLNVLIEVMAAAFMVFDLPAALAMFGVDYSSQLDILGLVMSNALFFVAGIAALAIVWTVRGRREGVICGIAVGLFLTSFGLWAFLLFGQWSAIVVDGARGGLNVLLGVLLLRNGVPAENRTPVVDVERPR